MTAALLRPARRALPLVFLLLPACNMPEHLAGPDLAPGTVSIAQPVTAAPLSQGAAPVPAAAAATGVPPLLTYPALSSEDYGACAVVLATGRALNDPDGFQSGQAGMQKAVSTMIASAPDPARARAVSDEISDAAQDPFYAYVRANLDLCRQRHPYHAQALGA
ncbi:hypothetical protein [Poseidonocella sp. HB161398]|uniref:hypothetical protein n=1 Tax=Poseidonocella sp. HB161398 TaxID=2320855 RepID=UPI0011093652|nr:hypothetical protein [Poseidonocella sp. HB161398]